MVSSLMMALSVCLWLTLVSALAPLVIIVAVRPSIDVLLILTPILNALVTGHGYEFFFTIPSILTGFIGLFLLYLFENLYGV